MQSVVVGQAPITLEWKKYLGSKAEAKNKKQACIHTHSTTINKDTREAKRRLLVADKPLKKEDEAKQKQNKNKSR